MSETGYGVIEDPVLFAHLYYGSYDWTEDTGAAADGTHSLGSVVSNIVQNTDGMHLDSLRSYRWYWKMTGSVGIYSPSFGIYFSPAAGVPPASVMSFVNTDPDPTPTGVFENTGISGTGFINDTLTYYAASSVAGSHGTIVTTHLDWWIDPLDWYPEEIITGYGAKG